MPLVGTRPHQGAVSTARILLSFMYFFHFRPLGSSRSFKLNRLCLLFSRLWPRTITTSFVGAISLVLSYNTCIGLYGIIETKE